MLHSRPTSAFEALDSALLVARRAGSAFLVRAWGGGAVLSMVVLLTFYFERVEHVRTLRPLSAFAITLAICVRGVLLSRAARLAVQYVFTTSPLMASRGSTSAAVRTTLVFALGAWVWAWFALLMIEIGWLAFVLTLPIYALRGLIAPAWLARAGCEPEGGVRAFFRSLSDGDGRRLLNAGVELLVLVGSALLALNVYLLSFAVAALARTFLALDVGFAETFLDFENSFLQLGVALLVFTLLEPVRASVSALVYADARIREDGVDLRQAIDEAITLSRGRSAQRAAIAAAILLAASWCLAPGSAQAQPPIDPPAESIGVLPVSTLTPADMDARARAERILSGPDFVEVPKEASNIDEAFERFWAWLFRARPPVQTASPNVGIPMPPVEVFLALAGLVLLGALALVLPSLFRAKRMSRAPKSAQAVAASSPIDVAPEVHLDDAALLASKGNYRGALRALYLATLVALDRQKLIVYDDARTNWQYLRDMRRGEGRDLFTQFTRLFDHKWYGEEEATLADYEASRALATRICAMAEERAA